MDHSTSPIGQNFELEVFTSDGRLCVGVQVLHKIHTIGISFLIYLITSGQSDRVCLQSDTFALRPILKNEPKATHETQVAM